MDYKKLIEVSKKAHLTIPVKLEVYRELSRYLRQGDLDDGKFNTLEQSFYKFAVRDIDAQNASVCALAMEVLGFFLQKMTSFEEGEVSELVKLILASIIRKNQKEISRNGMWCIQKLASQNPDQLSTAVCKRLVTEIIPWFLAGNLIPSSSIFISIPDLLLIVNSIEPELIKSRLPKLMPRIFRFLSNNVVSVRSSNLKFMQHFRTVSSDVIRKEMADKEQRGQFCDSLVDLVAKQQDDALDIWEFVVGSLGITLSKSVEMLNALLRTPEKAFASSNLAIREKGVLRWAALIDAFAVEPSVLNHEKRLRLVLMPLRNIVPKSEAIAKAQMQVWLHVLRQLGPALEERYELTVESYFNFMLGEEKGLLHLYPKLLPKIVESWAEVLKLLPPLLIKLFCKSYFDQAHKLLEKADKNESSIPIILVTMVQVTPQDLLLEFQPLLKKLWFLGSTKHDPCKAENVEERLGSQNEEALEEPMVALASRKPIPHLLRYCFVRCPDQVQTFVKVVTWALMKNPFDMLPELASELAREVSRPETFHCWMTAASSVIRLKQKNTSVKFDVKKLKLFTFLPLRFSFDLTTLAVTDNIFDTFEELCHFYCSSLQEQIKESELNTWLEELLGEFALKGHVFFHVALFCVILTWSPSITRIGWTGLALQWLGFMAKKLIKQVTMLRGNVTWEKRFGLAVRTLILNADSKSDLDALQNALSSVLSNTIFSDQEKTLKSHFQDRYESKKPFESRKSFESKKSQVELMKNDSSSPSRRKSKLISRKLEDFVYIAPMPSQSPRVLTEHQKEVLRAKASVIPAMYNDYSQSSLGYDDSQSLLGPVAGMKTVYVPDEACLTSTPPTDIIAKQVKTKRLLRSTQRAKVGKAASGELENATKVLDSASNGQSKPTQDLLQSFDKAAKNCVKKKNYDKISGKKQVKEGSQAEMPAQSSSEPVPVQDVISPEPGSSSEPLPSTVISVSMLAENESHEPAELSNVTSTETSPSVVSPQMTSPIPICGKVCLDHSNVSTEASPLKARAGLGTDSYSVGENLDKSEPAVLWFSPDRTLETAASTSSVKLSLSPENLNASASNHTPIKSQVSFIPNVPVEVTNVMSLSPSDFNSTPERSTEKPAHESVRAPVLPGLESSSSVSEPPRKREKLAVVKIKPLPFEHWCRQAFLLGDDTPTSPSKVEVDKSGVSSPEKHHESIDSKITGNAASLHDDTLNKNESLKPNGHHRRKLELDVEDAPSTPDQAEAEGSLAESDVPMPLEDGKVSSPLANVVQNDSLTLASGGDEDQADTFVSKEPNLAFQAQPALVPKEKPDEASMERLGLGLDKVWFGQHSVRQGKLQASLSRQNGAKASSKGSWAKSVSKTAQSLTGLRGARLLELAQARNSMNATKIPLTETPKKISPTPGHVSTSPVQNSDVISVPTQAASPGILKRRLANGDTPSPKSRKVSFAVPETGEEIGPSPALKSRRSLTLDDGTEVGDEELAKPLEACAENVSSESFFDELDQCHEAILPILDGIMAKPRLENVNGVLVQKGVSQIGEFCRMGAKELREMLTPEELHEIRIALINFRKVWPSLGETGTKGKDDKVVADCVLVKEDCQNVSDIIDDEPFAKPVSEQKSTELEVPSRQQLVEWTKNGVIDKDTVLAMIASLPMTREERVDFMCAAMKHVLSYPQ